MELLIRDDKEPKLLPEDFAKNMVKGILIWGWALNHENMVRLSKFWEYNQITLQSVLNAKHSTAINAICWIRF